MNRPTFECTDPIDPVRRVWKYSWNHNEISFAVAFCSWRTQTQIETEISSDAFFFCRCHHHHHSACNECNTSPGFFLRSFPSFVAFPPLSQAICNEKSHTSNTFSQCRVQCYGFKMQTVCCGLGTIVQHRIHELVTQTCNKRPCLSAACFVCVRAMRVCLVASLAWFWFRVT